MMLAGRLLSGPEVALVVEIHPISDRIEPALDADLLHDGEKFVLALKTTLPVIANVLGPIKLGRGNNFDRNSLFTREREGVSKMGASQTGGVGDYGEHLVSQDTVSGPGEEG